MPRKASSVMEERLRFQRSQLPVAPLCRGAHVRNQVTALFADVVARIVGLACRLEPGALTDVRASWSGVSAECPSFKMTSRDPLMNVISGSSTGVDFFHASIASVAIAGSISVAFAHRQRIKGRAAARQQAETAWNAVQSAWSQQAGNKNFLEVKAEAEKLMLSLARLPEQE
jgi:hypothetical protein